MACDDIAIAARGTHSGSGQLGRSPQFGLWDHANGWDLLCINSGGFQQQMCRVISTGKNLESINIRTIHSSRETKVRASAVASPWVHEETRGRLSLGELGLQALIDALMTRDRS